MSAPRKRSEPIWLILIILVFGFASTGFAQKVPKKYEQYIQRFPDNRTLFERLLNKADLTLEEIGPAFALVAGIDTYPKLRGRTSLRPAGVDVDKLVEYLKGQERFVEVVVLRNEAVTLENLDYFLTRYFPKKLQGVPNGRFLLAFSGHGVQEGSLGFLLKPGAERLDAEFGISLNVVKGLYDRILHHAHQSLVLINSCHSGALLEREAYGRIVPLDPGHWAITAGGNAEEMVWHDKTIGPGSIFFEKLFAALDGRADRLPEQPNGTFGDGLVTVEELFSYLKQEVQIATKQSQNPRMGNISVHGDHGSFFFFDRKRRIAPPPPSKKSPTVAFGDGIDCDSGDDCFSKGDVAMSRKDYSEAKRLYREACGRGDARGCTNLGLMYENGQGVTKDESRALELYRQGCAGGHAMGCTYLGINYTSGIVVAKDDSRAVEFYRQGCAGGHAMGCTYLGISYTSGIGVAKDDFRAVEFYRKGCDGGSAAGCSNLGLMYENGQGVTKDESLAVGPYRQACAGGHARGCSNLGLLYEHGKGVAKDEPRAVELYRQACDGGDVRGCSNLGSMYETGRGVAKDESRAMELYRQGCDGGSALDCSNLGLLYEHGKGVAKNEPSAVELYRQACDGGDVRGCSNLGSMYENGRGVAKDESRAVELYQQACEAGSNADCLRLLILGVGQGALKDKFQLLATECEGGTATACLGFEVVPKAGRGLVLDPRLPLSIKTLHKGCDEGSVVFCEYLGTLYEEGVVVAKDKARAVELYRQACDGGSSRACKRLQ